LYVGNYDFWHQSSQLALRLVKDSNKKKEEKIKELEAFVARFSANASKSKQATSRKKALEKIQIDQIEPSSRRYPFIGFDMERKPGKELLEVTNLNKTIDGVEVLKNVTFELNPFDKAVLLGSDLQKSTLLKILAGELEPDSGEVKWGVTVHKGYLPSNNDDYFKDNDTSLIEWLREYSSDPHEAFIRGFLGRMLFSGDEPLKKVKVLSGGEKMRCMFSKLMLSNANTLLIDQPTNHLDLESIQAVNEGLIAYKGSIVFASHDQEFINTIANKVVEITDNGCLALEMQFEDYLNSDKVQDLLKNINK
jgi:ATPase subunit of ABC transporter with duplicated ATPase domains